MHVSKIGILGKGGSGKDTVADYLKTKGYDAVAFSDGLYDICREFYGMNKKDRALLQDVGSAMRSVDEDVFVNRALNALRDSKKCVITDVRAVNEYERLKEKGYTFIRIMCPLSTRIERIEKRDGIVCDHAYIDRLENAPIETYLDGYDAIEIDNSAEIEKTFKQIDELLGL